MNVKQIKVGDWIKDTHTNYELRAGLNELGCAYLFEGVPITEEFLDRNKFKKETVGEESVYYREEDGANASLRRVGQRWEMNINNLKAKARFSVCASYVHDLQHGLSDCFIFWDIVR